MSLAISFHFLCTQHVSDINISIFRSLQQCCWITTLVVLQTSACNTDTTQTQPHQISNTQRTENKMTNVVIQQHSRKLLMMDILISETCWAHKKWNKISSDIKLVFYSSTITMMHGPIRIRFMDNMLYHKKFHGTLPSIADRCNFDPSKIRPCLLLNIHSEAPINRNLTH